MSKKVTTRPNKTPGGKLLYIPADTRSHSYTSRAIRTPFFICVFNFKFPKIWKNSLISPPKNRTLYIIVHDIMWEGPYGCPSTKPLIYITGRSMTKMGNAAEGIQLLRLSARMAVRNRHRWLHCCSLRLPSITADLSPAVRPLSLAGVDIQL